MKSKSAEYVYDSDDASDLESQFVPPKGYRSEKLEKIKLDDADEVFLVQLPPSVDLKKISNIPLEDGSFEIDGVKYNLSRHAVGVSASSSNAKQLQLFTRKKDHVKPSSHKISARLNVVRAVDIPSIDYDNVRVAKPIVQQKTNLKMRVFPTGYSLNDYSSTSYSSAVDVPSTSEPPAKKRKSSSKKSKSK